MNIEILSKTECCGCRGCQNVCPVNAIHFETDSYGFEYPEVDCLLCTNCGLCQNVCPVLNAPAPEKAFPLCCGAAYALDAKTKFEGSSGGLFGVFAKEILQRGGIVYGAAFDEELRLKTRQAETEDELEGLYKSKYLLCDTNNQFKSIRNQLASGRSVLYCSSPCQIAALKLFLNKNYKNLYTIDFVCHGVGSQELFDRSIRYTEKKLGGKIKKVIFRYKVKKASSHYYYYYYYYERAKRFFEKSDLYLFFPYYNGYEHRLLCRDCCYSCKFATENRIGDITIGDFHTIQKYEPTIDRFAGVSMFVCNTQHGQTLFDSVREQLFVREMSWDLVRMDNRFSNEKERMPKEREAFMESVAQEPFEKTVSRFLRPSRYWIHLLYYRLPKFLRDLAMKIIK